MTKARRETPARRQSLIDGRQSVPQLRVQDRRRSYQKEAIVGEAERADVRDGRQYAALDGRVRLTPGVEQSSGHASAEVADHRAHGRRTVVAPGRRRCHRYPTDGGPERQAAATGDRPPPPHPASCRQMNGDAVEQMLELLERDETPMSRTSFVAVHAVFDAEFVREQIEVGDAVQNDALFQLLGEPVAQRVANSTHEKLVT